MRTGTRPRAALTVVLAAVLLATIADSLRSQFVSWDTLKVVATADSALAHLRHGQRTGWGGGYPLLQAIPAFVLRGAGLSIPAVITGLVALNVVAFTASSWMSWRYLRRQSKPTAILLLAVLLSGMMLWYLHSSFGEPLAAAVTVAAVAACWRHRGHAGVFAFVFLSGVAKDTAAPFVLTLGLGASIGNACWADTSFRRHRVVTLVLAASTSILVNFAYNYARFGTVVDQQYMSPALYVPWLQTQLGFAAAVWLAPNGGLLLFWPSFAVLVLLSTFAAVRTARMCQRWPERPQRLAPAVAVAGTLAGMTAELSKWVVPLGWAAYGSRLILPWVPACAFLLAAAYSPELDRLVASLVRPVWRSTVWGVVIALASFPQYVAIVRPNSWQLPLLPDAECPNPVIIESGAAYYYHCVNHMMWTKGSMLLAAYAPNGDLFGYALACGSGIAFLWLLYTLRSALRAATQHAAGEAADLDRRSGVGARGPVARAPVDTRAPSRNDSLS